MAGKKTKRQAQRTGTRGDTGDALFARIIQELSKDSRVQDPRVAQSRGFGSTGLKAAGKLFAMMVKGRLVVKLPKHRVDALVASRKGEYFDPGHGRLMKEWVAVGIEAKGTWLSLAREALEFVAGAA
jgi:hypothetical protein